MVISGRYTFCWHTIIVKNMYMSKLVYIKIFKNSLKKWLKDKLKTFSHIYIYI